MSKLRKELCPGCGESVPVVKKDYLFEESGLSNVVLDGIDIIECPDCGDSAIIPQLEGLLRALTLAIIKMPMRLRGEDIRFLRKRVHKTGIEFARLLHVDNTTLSKWENDDDPVGDQSDRLIRLLALALDPELMKQSQAAVESFAGITARKKPMKISIDRERLCQYA